MKRILLLSAILIGIAGTSATAQVTLSGNIYYDSTSRNDSFKVWLIVKNGNVLSAVDSQNVVGLAGWANYSFSGVAQGSYRVKAQHTSPTSMGPSLAPTYHDSALLWSNAGVINIGGTNSTGNIIYMKHGTNPNGPGFIGGNVNQGANKGTANGIEGMDVYVMDANGDFVASTVTDANGAYTFPSLPYGTYSVHPEQMNFATTNASIVLDAANPSKNAIDFERSLTGQTIMPKTSSVTGIAVQDVFTIYPNPAADVVNINWNNATNEDAVITVSDVSGRTVINTTATMSGRTTVEVSQLQSGVYIMNIAAGADTYTQKLILQ